MALVFFLNGFGFANWVPRLAEVKLGLGLGEAAFGFALLGLAGGALLAMPLTGALCARFGSRAVTATALFLFAPAPILLALAPGLLGLAGAFLAIGVMAGALDVAMNAQGVAVERRYPKPIMSGLHGMFSLGAMVGALCAGGLAAAGLDLLPHLMAVAGILIAAGLVECPAMLPARFDASGAGPAFALPTRGLLLLGAIAFCALMAEGAVADWSAIYLHQSLGAGTELAAAAFATFSVTMAAGRFAGDRLIARFGAVLIARAGAALAAAGLAGTLASGHPGLAIVGFGLIGAGIACTFPIVLSAAARAGDLPAGHAIAAAAFATFSVTMAAGRFAGDRLIARFGAVVVARAGAALAAAGLAGTLLSGHPGIAIAGFGLIGAGIACTFPIVLSAAARAGDLPAGHAIAAVCTLGYFGFLVGPPTIGLVAELTGLPQALGILLLLFGAILLLGGTLRPARLGAQPVTP